MLIRTQLQATEPQLKLAQANRPCISSHAHVGFRRSWIRGSDSQGSVFLLLSWLCFSLCVKFILQQVLCICGRKGQRVHRMLIVFDPGEKERAFSPSTCTIMIWKGSPGSARVTCPLTAHKRWDFLIGQAGSCAHLKCGGR